MANMDLKFIFFAFYATICLFDVIVCETIIVETHSGPVKGSVIVFNEHKINQFLGIPYAEPPIGGNRFGKPKPVQKWTQTVDATHVKNMCWQSSPAKAQSYNQSEDCLFLNIWSENINDTKLRAVMFYIHGGGLHDGNGYIDGMSLTSYGVVMVSVNYRLGPFGFLYGGEPSAPGNVGIYDQVLALEWVNNNIERFGGDPKQITIFGQSAGSWSVSALIVSPLSTNLFKRAIMESGAYFFKNYRDYNNSNRLAEAHKTAHSIGCANDTKWLDCLRKAEPTEIVKHNSVSPSLVFNNELLPYKLEDAVKLGKFKTGIEVMAGVTESEGTGWAASGTFGHKLSNTSYHITKDEIKTQIKSKFHSSGDAFVDKIYDFYISKVDENNQTLIRKAYIAIFSDTIMKCPTYYFAEKLAKFSAANKVRFYEVTYNSIHSACHSQQWQGVCHADELLFVFGTPIRSRSTFSETDYEFSLMISQMWTNFAKNGNPLSQSVTNTLKENITNWPVFRATEESPVSPKVMELNPSKFGHLFNDPYRGNCDELWKQYFGID